MFPEGWKVLLRKGVTGATAAREALPRGLAFLAKNKPRSSMWKICCGSCY